MTAFAHKMTNHANRAVIVKVASKNMKVVIIFYLDDISMWSGHIPLDNLLWMKNRYLMQQSVLKLAHKHYPMYLNLELQATI